MATKSRKRHAPITDTDSDESLTASQSQSKSSVPKKPYVPRFLIIHSEVEGKDISLLSPFLIEKAIMSIAGEPKSIKNLRSGDLLIQCTKQPHETNLLKMKTFCGLKCTVTPHQSLNTSKGIVRCPALSKQSCEHILEFMGEQGVTDVHTINVQIHLDVINVKCLAITKISVADKRYASTAVCLIIAHLASVKDLPSVPTAQVIILLTQKIAHNGRKREKSLK